MMMFAPLGAHVKQADPALREFRLAACPDCQAPAPTLHGTRLRLVPVGLKGMELGEARVGADDVLEQDVVKLRLRRYDCQACGGHTTVAPDCLVPGAVYPAKVREWARQAYLSGAFTYQQAAAQIGCSKSTCWRWMRELTNCAAGWLQSCRAQLAAAGAPVGPVVLPLAKLALWQRRRIRARGMLEGLLVAEALDEWVDKLRQAWRQRPRVLPSSVWAFGIHVLDRLAAAATQSLLIDPLLGFPF